MKLGHTEYLEEEVEVRIVTAALGLKISEILQFRRDLQHVVHHFSHTSRLSN